MQLCFCVQLLFVQWVFGIGQTIIGHSNKVAFCYCVQLLFVQCVFGIGQPIIGHSNKVAFC